MHAAAFRLVAVCKEMEKWKQERDSIERGVRLIWDNLKMPQQWERPVLPAISGCSGL